MSRLVSIELINFMSLPYAEFEFDESGIICPVGYNDSGKSVLRRALEVLWFDEHVTLQVKYITDGRPSFVIRNKFDDGVLIERTKFSTGQSHWRMLKDDKAIYDNKLPSGTYSAVRGVPDAIRSYLGVVKDDATGEILNIRRNTNKLLGIETTGGENYKIFNNLCQGERLAYAVDAINKDVNAENRDLTSKLSRLQGQQDLLAGMKVIPEEQEKDLSKLSMELQRDTTKLDCLCNLADCRNGFYNSEVIAPIPIVELDQLQMLMNLMNLKSAYNVEVIQQVAIIDLAQLELLYKLKSLSAVFDKTVIECVPEVNYEQLELLQKVCNAYVTLNGWEKYVSDGTAWLQQEKKLLKEAALENKWEICPECGTVITVSEEVLHSHA